MTRCANFAKKTNADAFIFRYSDTNEEEIKCLFRLLYFRDLYQDTKQPTKELWYDTFSAKKIYRAAMSLNRFKRLERTRTFYDHNTVRVDFLEDRFARMRSFLTEFEKNVWKYYRNTEFVVMDKTLRNFYVSYNCGFKVYMKDKPGNYGFLVRVLADAQDRYASRVIPHVTQPIYNPEKREISMT